MVCYQVNLFTVEFKLKNIDLAMKTLKDLKLNPFYDKNKNIIYFGIQSKIDLTNQTITVPDTIKGATNLIKRKYSENAIEIVAKKKKWIMKRFSENKMEVRRY